MPLVATDRPSASRKRAMGVFLRQGIVGVALLTWLTITRIDEPMRIIGELGPSAPILIAILIAFAFTLALLKFKLTDQIFVSLMVTAVFASFPLLGSVMTSWIAVVIAIGTRGLGVMQIGPVKIEVVDRRLEQARLFGMFGTYGVPAVFGTIVYEQSGGVVPLLTPSVASALQIAAYAVVFTLTNNVITGRVENAFGYSLRTSLKLGVIDSSIYMITLPFAMLTTFSYGAIGWGGTLAAAFTGVVTNMMARKLTSMRGDQELLARRLASLTNIGKSISLKHSTEELLRIIYHECRKVMDVTIFGIALLDEGKQELKSVLAVEENKSLPPFRFPLGTGLTSWVIRNRAPLLLGSSDEEVSLGLKSVDDGLPTESWLGVPMIARDHILGVISVESYKKNAFATDDVVLLMTIANQAAVAIDDANLFQDLEQINTVLEARVADRTIELREANLRLLSADRSKNQFLANMSHELRTPLNSIIGFSSVLIDATKETMQPRLYKFLQNIRTAGSHLLTLINDILDLAKIESGKLQINPHSFDMRETISIIERVMKGIAAESSVTIVTSIDPDIGSVYLDEGRIKQVLLNLLSNAVKFSHNGDYVYMTVSRISESESKLECDTLRIDVQDHGIGIPETELDKIFEEFYQVRAPGALHKGGTGLGLPLTRSFVELHRGTIEVSSTIGDGSTFTILVPSDYRVLASRSMSRVADA